MLAMNALVGRASAELGPLSLQVAALVALVGAATWMLRRTAPQWRYALWMIVVARLCVPMGVAAPWGWLSIGAPAAGASSTSDSIEPAPLPPPWSLARPFEFSISDSAFHGPPAPASSWGGIDAATARRLAGLDEAIAAPAAAIEPAPVRPVWFVALGFAWVIGAALLAAFVLARAIWIGRQAGRLAEVDRDDLKDRLNRLRAESGLRRTVRLLLASGALEGAGPAVIGWRRPAILLPRAIAAKWSADDVEPILLHELAHLRRRDPAVNALQVALQVLYFFHPFVWWANHRIRQEREMACDDEAIARCKGGPASYGRCVLAAVEAGSRGRGLGLLGLAMAERRSSLGRRLARVLDRDYRSARPMRRAAWLGVAMAGLAVVGATAERWEASGVDGQSLHTGVQDADEQARQERMKEREALMNAPLTIKLDRPIPISDFMKIVSLSTPVELRLLILAGPEKSIVGKFTKMPLKDVLDAVLAPLALTWSLDENRLLTIRSADRDADESESAGRQTADEQLRQERERRRAELLSSPITLVTERPTLLSEFINIVSISTRFEFQYLILDGADEPIFGNFGRVPLEKVLDLVLSSKGLTWSLSESNLLTIRRELRTKSYALSTESVEKIRSLLDGGVLQQLIWNQPQAPQGAELALDDRSSVLLVSGTESHIEKLEKFLQALPTVASPKLELRIYTIREEMAPAVKSMIEAVLQASEGGSAESDSSRRVLITGSELIIRDTPENIVKIEELLLDQKFIDALVDESLEIANFSLIPRNLETEDPEALAASTARVVKQIETFLYAVTGIEEAEKQGRRLWYDESTLQLTIVDTSYNISRVGRFIKSLPDLRRQDLEEVIFLRHADAAELVKELVEILGIYVREARGADSSHSATRRLRRGDRFEFRGLRLQLNRVHENDPIDRDDDSVELIVTTSGGGSGVNQLREFVRMLIDEYEIVVERVDPIRPGDGNNNRPGDGTAEITVRLPGLANEPPPAARAEPTPDPEEQVGLTAIERLNAIIVQYQNPSDLDRIQELIRQLDTPTPRIDVQWVALRIDEARARSHGLDVGSWISRERPLALRPGAASEEYELWLRDLFEPSLPAAKESELRLLEAQGALSVLRGPTLTAMNERATELRLNSADPKAEPNVIVSFKPRIASSESVALSDVTVDWLVAGGADAAARRRRQVIHTPEHRLRDGEVVVLGGWSEPAAAANEGEAARPEAVYLILRASIVAP